MRATVEALQETVVPILRDFGVVRAGVFGSRARAQAGPDSLLDLLVEFEKDRSLLDLVGLELELSDRLGLKPHVVTYQSLHPLLRDRILSDEVGILL